MVVWVWFIYIEIVSLFVLHTLPFTMGAIELYV